LIVAIHQPQFMPWLGYFDKMDRADCFVLLDNVQFKKNEWQNRNKIRALGGTQWLTVPVTYRFPQKISEVNVHEGGNWRRKQLQALRTNYSTAAHWKDAEEWLTSFYSHDWRELTAINRASIEWISEILDISTPLRWASSMKLRSDPTDRLLDICDEVGADTYLSGAGGREYLQVDRFSGAGVEVTFQEFAHPAYTQNLENFESHLSAIDLILNCGKDSSRIFRTAQQLQQPQASKG
jgi:hypothetical protein